MKKLRNSFNMKGPVANHFLLQRLYEIEFNLHDHTSIALHHSDPLAVIRAKPEEALSRSSHMWDLAERFARAKIKERFGMSWLEYINLPMPDAYLLNVLSFEVIANVEIEETKRNQEAQKAALEASKQEAAQEANKTKTH